METTTYHLTSPNFDGHVIFVFNLLGKLLKYDTTEATLDNKQRDWITKRLPDNLLELKALFKMKSSGKLTEQKQAEVTFEMFWNKYDEKTRSSKKKTKLKWDRLTQTNRDRAFNFIDNYLRNIPPGVSKKYANTYLEHELWNN